MIGDCALGRAIPPNRCAAGIRLARNALALVLGLSLVSLPPARAADDMPIPVEDQVTLILKTLTYDRQLEAKAKGNLTLGIVYNPADPASVKVGRDVSDVLTKFATKRVKGLPLSQYLVEYATPAQLDVVAKSRPITVFYICPGVKGLDYLLKVAEQYQITTTTGVPSFVKQGVAVGVGFNGEKAQMLVNRPTAKAEGVEFEARLLSIMTRVGE
jgi:hypothetical protein